MAVAYGLYFLESDIKKYQLCTRFWQVFKGVFSLRWGYGLPMFFVQTLANGFQLAKGPRQRELERGRVFVMRLAVHVEDERSESRRGLFHAATDRNCPMIGTTNLIVRSRDSSVLTVYSADVSFRYSKPGDRVKAPCATLGLQKRWQLSGLEWGKRPRARKTERKPTGVCTR